MSHRYEISRQSALLTGRPGDAGVEAPGVPQNLNGQSQNEGEELLLTWDAPSSGGTVLYYEIAEDGDVIGTSDNLNFLVGGIEYGVSYEFKVRSVGKFSLKSAYSSAFNWTGGGLPVMEPVLQGGYLSATLQWNEVPSNQDFTIEGYNVYYHNGSSFVKQNGSLLALDETVYTKEELGVSEFVRMGVSFEYNSGTESQIFDDESITHSGPGGSYLITIHGTWKSWPLISPEGNVGLVYAGGWNKVGLEVAQGTVALATPDVPEGFGIQRIWTSPDSWTYSLSMSYTGTTKYDFVEGCDSNEGTFLKKTGLSPVSKTIEGTTQLYASISRTGGFAWSGPECAGSTYTGVKLDVYVSFAPENFRALHDPDFNAYEIYEHPIPEPVVTADVTGSDVDFSWDAKSGIDGYNLYLKESADPSYSKQNSSLLTTNSYEIDGLSNGTYSVFVTLVKKYDNYTYETDTGSVRNVTEFTINV